MFNLYFSLIRVYFKYNLLHRILLYILLFFYPKKLFLLNQPQGVSENFAHVHFVLIEITNKYSIKNGIYASMHICSIYIKVYIIYTHTMSMCFTLMCVFVFHVRMCVCVIRICVFVGVFVSLPNRWCFCCICARVANINLYNASRRVGRRKVLHIYSVLQYVSFCGHE